MTALWENGRIAYAYVRHPPQYTLTMRQAHLRRVQLLQDHLHATGESTIRSSPSSRHILHSIGNVLDDIPIQAADYEFCYDESAELKSACRKGPVEEVQCIIAKERSTPRFLYCGLVAALRAGQVEVVRYLLSAGAVVSRDVPCHVLMAPEAQQIPLFEVLAEHGWTPNMPSYYGEVLLPSVVTNLPVLRWFLDHGANPNLGIQRPKKERMGKSDTKSCSALESAAESGTLDAVRLLLDAGARVEYGIPLHCAAGARLNGTDINNCPSPTREFDEDRVSIMDLLVKHGVDVNQRDEWNYHVLRVPRLPILIATMAGAVERVRWLLEQGADPEADGGWGSAVSRARYRSEEMKRVIEEGVRARRWVKTQDGNGIMGTRTSEAL